MVGDRLLSPKIALRNPQLQIIDAILVIAVATEVVVLVVIGEGCCCCLNQRIHFLGLF